MSCFYDNVKIYNITLLLMYRDSFVKPALKQYIAICHWLLCVSWVGYFFLMRKLSQLSPQAVSLYCILISFSLLKRSIYLLYHIHYNPTRQNRNKNITPLSAVASTIQIAEWLSRVWYFPSDYKSQPEWVGILNMSAVWWSFVSFKHMSIHMYHLSAVVYRHRQ